MPVVKKSVAIHPVMDKYVRKTWALLVESGFDATYSTALNFMLLATVMEAQKKGGLTKYTRDTIWSFMSDESTIKELNLEDQLANYPKYIIEEEVTTAISKSSKKLRETRMIEK